MNGPGASECSAASNVVERSPTSPHNAPITAPADVVKEFSPENELKQRLDALRKRSFLQRFVDSFYGFDYFISYTWSDGREYAISLASELRREGLDCFLDSDNFEKGHNFVTVGDRSLQNTSRLIVVASPHIHDSDAVLKEVRVFANAPDKKIIPIRFDQQTLAADLDPEPELLRLLNGHLRIDEEPDRLGKGPSRKVIKELISSFNVDRQSQKRTKKWRQLMYGAILVFTCLAVVAAVFLGMGLINHVSAVVNDVRSDNIASKAEAIRTSLMHWPVVWRLESSVTTNAQKIHVQIAVAPRTANMETALDGEVALCANEAVVLANLDRWWAVSPLLAYRDDMRLRSQFIFQTRRSLQTFAALATEIERLLKDTNREHAGQRQALLLCLPEKDRVKLDCKQLESVTKTIIKTFCEDPDPGVHSAAEFVLRRWSLRKELDDCLTKLALERTEDKLKKQLPSSESVPPSEFYPRWYVTPSKVTMVVIPPQDIRMGIPPHFPGSPDAKDDVHSVTVKSSRWFAIATTELPASLFDQFVKDSNLKPEEVMGREFGYEKEYLHLKERDGLDTPALDLSRPFAMRFCDWLSVKDGCPNTTPTSGLDQWLGYRLPTEAEWELACQSGAKTPRFFGYSANCLADYAVFEDTQLEVQNDNRLPRPIAERLPSAWGLFDLYGNAQELCLDSWRSVYEPWQAGPADVLPRQSASSRGGDVNSSSNQCFSAYRLRVRSDSGGLHLGFRIAKTIAAKTTAATSGGASKLPSPDVPR